MRQQKLSSYALTLCDLGPLSCCIYHFDVINLWNMTVVCDSVFINIHEQPIHMHAVHSQRR